MQTLSFHPFAKVIALFAAFFLAGTFLHAQDVTGTWNGVLNTGVNLRLVFHIEKTCEGYTSTMDSPDQGAMGLPVATTTFDGATLSLAIPAIRMSYEGEWKTDSIVGTFKQNGLSLPMTLTRKPAEAKLPVRPQEPKPPYPYRSEEITFDNKAAGITLSGTLTMPPTGSNFTAVILISGSGAQNRDEELMGHKPFLVIADYLTRQGIAVLRYDDRGTAQSTGNFRTATTADFASDAESALAYLKTRKEINRHKIGLMGHSEGGVIAPMVATKLKDVGFIVMLAGTGVRGDQLLLSQQEAISSASGMSESDIAKTLEINSKVFKLIVQAKEEVSRQELTDFMTGMKAEMEAMLPEGMPFDQYIQQYVRPLAGTWMQYFLRYDPAPALENVKCPVLAINGSKDLQVPAKENLPAISAALKKGGNRNVSVKEYPRLNHLFQECTTGLLSEYFAIEQTFSPDVLKDLASWILNIP